MSENFHYHGTRCLLYIAFHSTRLREQGTLNVNKPTQPFFVIFNVRCRGARNLNIVQCMHKGIKHHATTSVTSCEHF